MRDVEGIEHVLVRAFQLQNYGMSIMSQEIALAEILIFDGFRMLS